MTPQPKMTMDPLKKKTRLYEDIVELFKKKIEDGDLRAGDRLPTERELVEQLGVSRTSVREALRAMELVGLIESKVGEGTFIKSSGIDEAILRVTGGVQDERRVLEMYEVRVLLEPYAARVAARKRSQAQLRDMRLAIESMRDEITKGERGQRGDIRFHGSIAEAAGNSILIGILGAFAEALGSSIAVANAHVHAADIIAEHQRMFDAIEERDETEAERLMHAHIKRAIDRTRFISGRGTAH
ncbi:MAG: FadR family transcriptional regulator [Planctomycetaceae bacterium]|nr:FadR family transcriptional regulator [Planctomycetaceae bacterium]